MKTVDVTFQNLDSSEISLTDVRTPACLLHHAGPTDGTRPLLHVLSGAHMGPRLQCIHTRHTLHGTPIKIPNLIVVLLVWLGS